jgi:hypothetical protein
MCEKKILIILIVLVLIYIAVKYFKSNKKEKFTTSSKSKIIKFFGADYCPYSNEQSASYKVMKDLEEKYPDVQIYYYWIGKDDKEMNDLHIEYVPTILNGQNKEVELKLPEGVSREGKTGEELKVILLETIHNQLN